MTVCRLTGAAPATDELVTNPVATVVAVIVTAAIERENVRTDVLPAQQDGIFAVDVMGWSGRYTSKPVEFTCLDSETGCAPARVSAQDVTNPVHSTVS